jgi:ribonuclease H / adenosylcobalamin/alpha-ribazole phosphatase
MARRLIVEADGGSRGNPGPAGFGAAVMDAVTGEVLAEAAEPIGTATNNVAEYRGLIAGLTAAAAIAPDAAVEVRMDSKLVVEQMSGRWKIKHQDMVPLARKARELASGFSSVDYTWIPRERNKRADRLANEAMDGRPMSVRAVEESESLETEKGWTAPTSAATVGLLLRHGETPLSGERRFAGIGDIPLTEVGLEQARSAGRALVDRGIDVIVASPLKRTQQTAEEVAAIIGVEVRSEEGFRETDFGEWEGSTFGEARARWPAEMDAWLADPSVAPPGGESFVAVSRRVRTARDKMLVRFRHQTVLVVSHVTPIKMLVRFALEAPLSSLYRMHLDVASLSVVDWYDDGPAVVRGLNDTAHLRS